MNNKQDKGFTLVELLIVIVILGILATVTVFAVRGITDRGQENSCAVDARTLSTSIEAFYAQEQRDPIDQTELTVGPYVDPAADPLVRVAGAEPVLKDEPSNFRFVAPNVAPAYSYPPNSWNNPTGSAVAAPTIDSAQFVPTNGGACA
jgi:prepilin-type N-terminal cleavage/methylation domain-containing protein